MSFYAFMKKLLAGLIRKLWRVRVCGEENEREGTAYLICANHQSLLDVVLLGASIKHNPKYMAKKELTKIPLLWQLIKALGAFPVDRKGSDVAAIKKTINLLKSGESVSMFPQGTRHKGVCPVGTPVRHGCAMIALRADVAILPVFIKAKDYKVRLFRKTTLIIGKEISPDEMRAVMSSPEDYKSAADYVFSKIVELEGTV